jgi:predicted amidohydrolase
MMAVPVHGVTGVGEIAVLVAGHVRHSTTDGAFGRELAGHLSGHAGHQVGSDADNNVEKHRCGAQIPNDHSPHESIVYRMALAANHGDDVGHAVARVVGDPFGAVRMGERINQAFVFRDNSHTPAHEKHFLPDEPGFWEATWCSRGDGDFSVANAGALTVGFLICTEFWSFESARMYGKSGAHVIASPRASLLATRDKWLVAGRAAALVSGAFSLSSNRRGPGRQDIEFGGQGWIIDPDGKVLGVTSPPAPFLTADIDLDHAVQAKRTYPRDVAF